MKANNGLGSAPQADARALPVDDVFGTDLCEVGHREVREAAAPGRVRAGGARRAGAPQPQPDRYTGPIEFTILGQPASKANSRQIVLIGGKPKSIKSKEAREFERIALLQTPPAFRLQLTIPVAVTLRLFYASERPDLDESIVLDVLQNRYHSVELPGKGKVRMLAQAGVYANDRQVREKHVYHSIDRVNPRAEIRIVSIAPQETLL